MDATYLAFDYGRRRIGVAVGSRRSGRAQPLKVLACAGGRPDWRAIDALVAAWSPEALVVGLPLDMDGGRNPLTRAARRFGETLRQRYNLPVHMVDERLTSRSARATMAASGVSAPRMRRRGVDHYAAGEILDTFLQQLDRPLHDPD